MLNQLMNDQPDTIMLYRRFPFQPGLNKIQQIDDNPLYF